MLNYIKRVNWFFTLPYSSSSSKRSKPGALRSQFLQIDVSENVLDTSLAAAVPTSVLLAMEQSLGRQSQEFDITMLSLYRLASAESSEAEEHTSRPRRTQRDCQKKHSFFQEEYCFLQTSISNDLSLAALFHMLHAQAQPQCCSLATPIQVFETQD